MPCFPMFHPSFRSMLMLGLYAHMLNILSTVMLCLDLCVLMLYTMFLMVNLVLYLIQNNRGSNKHGSISFMIDNMQYVIF